jgi:hypothetical protein
MVRPAAVDSDPALSEPVVSVCSRRLRRWVWGLGWSNCGPVPAQATWATMQVCDSERCQHALRHALHCVASTGIAAQLENT